MFGRKIKQWFTLGRTVTLLIALVGLGLLVGGAVGTLAGRDTETVQAASVAPEAAPSKKADTAVHAAPVHAENTPQPRAESPPRDNQAAPVPLATSEPEPRIALAPVPDRDRPARRLADVLSTVPSAHSPGASSHSADNAEGGDVAWQRFAATAPVIDGPMIAIVIDDSGHDIARTRRLAAFADGVLTLAFLPYVDNLAEQTAIAREGGHEILLHLPMEPLNPELDTGPNVMTIDLPTATFDERLAWNLSRFEGYVGINNHMGSRFTADRPSMAHFMRTVHERGLLFLDSRTTTATVGQQTAEAANVPYLRRDVFLDNEPSESHVLDQLRLTEDVAKRQGYAIAIGHPHAWTIEALERWSGEARNRGFALVPLTAVLKYRQQKLAHQNAQ
jgi:uncharacterized protein